MNPLHKRLFAILGAFLGLVVVVAGCKYVGGVECNPTTQSCHVDVTRVTGPPRSTPTTPPFPTSDPTPTLTPSTTAPPTTPAPPSTPEPTSTPTP